MIAPTAMPDSGPREDRIEVRNDGQRRRSNARVGLALGAFALAVCLVFMLKIFLSR